MAAVRFPSVKSLPRHAVNEASPLVAKGSLTLNSFCTEKRKESDILLMVPLLIHDLNPISVFNYLYFLIKTGKKGGWGVRATEITLY